MPSQQNKKESEKVKNATKAARAAHIIKYTTKMKHVLNVSRKNISKRNTYGNDDVQDAAREHLQEEFVDAEIENATGDQTGDVEDSGMVEGQGSLVNELTGHVEHAKSIFDKLGVHVDLDINLKIPFVGHLKILIGFMQILTSMNFVFDVPWPGFFSRFLSSLMFVNIDVPNLFQGCEFAMSFEAKYYLHMSLLPTISIIMYIAYKIVLLLKKDTQMNIFGQYIKYLSITVFLLYSGMTAKIFQVFDCLK